MTKRHFLKAILAMTLLASGAIVSRPAQAQGAVPVAATNLPTIYLIGDSTVNNGTPGLRGWGSEIGAFFDPAKVHVENRARGGRSSRTYFNEGLWDAVVKNLKPGDYVLMQFGHNDGGANYTGDKGRSSIKGAGDETKDVVQADGKTETVHTYGWYLRRYAADAKAKGATPIVLSMIPRNDWNGDKVLRVADNYGAWAKQAAEAEKVPFVNLNEIVAEKYEAMGPEKVKPLFPQEHTHTSVEGAKINAESVVEGLKALPNTPFNAYLSAEGQAVEATKVQ